MLDDVSHPYRTEEIVRHLRCEMRDAVISSIESTSKYRKFFGSSNLVLHFDRILKEKKRIDDYNKPIANPQKWKPYASALSKEELWLMVYTEVAVAYDLNFDILETNDIDATAAFRLPLTAPAGLDVGANGFAHLTREGQRQFKANIKWGALVAKIDCNEEELRRRNLVYPISGSIGLERVVATFVDLVEQGGAKDSFVETLIFTTDVGIGAKAGLKLNGLQKHFKLIAADAAVAKARKDIHKIILSIVFPHEDEPDAITGTELTDGFLNAPYDRTPSWRARYNICVADARSREDEFRKLRLEAPEIYCITYADKFAPISSTANSGSPGAPRPPANAPAAGKSSIQSKPLILQRPNGIRIYGNSRPDGQ